MGGDIVCYHFFPSVWLFCLISSFLFSYLLILFSVQFTENLKLIYVSWSVISCYFNCSLFICLFVYLYICLFFTYPFSHHFSFLLFLLFHMTVRCIRFTFSTMLHFCSLKFTPSFISIILSLNQHRFFLKFSSRGTLCNSFLLAHLFLSSHLSVC